MLQFSARFQGTVPEIVEYWSFSEETEQTLAAIAKIVPN